MTKLVSRRNFLRNSVLAGAATVVAACTPATQAPAPTQAVSATKAPAATNPPAPAATNPPAPTAVKPTDAPAVLKGTTIKVYAQEMDVWHYWEKRAPELEKATGVKATFEYVSWPIILQQGEVELSSGSSNYDIMINPFVKSQRYMRAGWLAPLSDYIAKDKWALDDFIKPVLTAHSYNGAQYALPYLVESTQTIYRKDVFDKAGVKPPTTFDELEKVLAAIHNPKDFYAYVFRTQNDGFHFPFPIWLQGFGGDVFKNYPEDVTPTLNTPESLAAFENCANLITKYSIAPSQVYDTPDVQASMGQGKVGLWIDALGIQAPLLDKTKVKFAEQFAFALVPAGPKKFAPQFATHGIGISKASKNKEAAWEFVKWATSQDILKGAAIDSNNSPCPRTSVLTSAEYAKKYTIAGLNLGELINSAVSKANCSYRTLPEFAQIGSRMGQAMGEILTKQKTSKAALDSLQSDVTGILKTAGYKLN